MNRHAELEKEIAELKRRLYEIERRSAAVTAEEPLPEDGQLRAVVFRVEQARFALPLGVVDRVVPLAFLEPLPESPPWVLGLLRLGAEALPVIDLAARIDRKSREPELSEHIVICRDERTRIGLVVREVNTVASFRLGGECGECGGASTFGEANIPRGPYVRALLRDAEGLVILLSLRRLLATSDIPAEAPAS